jgi:GNAT superfamily N-acetyltransferase
MSTLQLEVCKFDESFLSEHQALFASYFPSDHQLLDPAYLRWLYIGNPGGQARTVIAREGGESIGFMALIPVALERVGEELQAYFVVNVLVHPAHQGKHVFGKMIQAARGFVNGEGAALMGHPNALALPQWRRSKMHFHGELQPMLVRPAPGNFLPHRQVRHLQAGWELWKELASRRSKSMQWQVKVSSDLLSWRFLSHPRKKYALYASGPSTNPVALHATTRVKHLARLLLDSYVAVAGTERQALSALPWPTIAMRPQRELEATAGFIKLPIDKRIPFFLTRNEHALRSDELVSVGLTATDF